MPWQVPTLADLRRQVRDYVRARLPQADAAVPNSPLRVISDNQAAMAALNLDYLAWVARQLMPDTAEKEWLDRHGDIWIGGRLDATYALGSVSFTGIAGTTVPSGTILSSSGATWQTTAAIVLGAGATEAAVEALTPGAVGNRDAGATLSLIAAISGVDASVTVVAIEGGIDAERDDHLRDRVLDRIRKPPMGGDRDDYIAWTKSTPTLGAAITRVWPAANEMGPGSMTVRFMMDEARSAFGGFPQPADLVTVFDHLETVRPVTVRDLYVVAPLPKYLAIPITNLSPDTSATRAGIIAALQAMVRERAEPGGTIYRVWIDDAIMSVSGVDRCSVTFADTAMDTAGHIAVVGSVSFA